MIRAEIQEASLHLREVWKLFARTSPGGEAFERVGLSIADGNQPWFFMNLAILSRPVANASDLRLRAKEGLEHFGARENPWVLTGSEDWFGPDPDTLLARLGLVRKLDLTAMVAERLSPPTRSTPEALLRRIDEDERRFALADINPPEVLLRRIDDAETRCALADINADAYGVPRAWGRRAVSSPALWRGPLFGRIAYLWDGPASGAFVLPVADALYVAWVATSKAHRRSGLAELVIRACLEDARRATGLERTILHATADGFPVYRRMGYRPVAKFPFYTHEAAPPVDAPTTCESGTAPLKS